MRFFYIQVIWSRQLVARATDQWNREIPVIASRGKIVDLNGTVLADEQEAYTVFARPSAILDKEHTVSVLSKILSINEGVLTEKMFSKKVSEVTVVRKISKDIVKKIVEQNLNGIYYAQDNIRYYPYRESLCQVLGFTSIDGYGQSGLEKYYNNHLMGKNGQILYETDIVGKERPEADVVYEPAQDGSQLQLTIDIDVQISTERILKQTYQTSGAKSVSCIVIDPNDFAVRSMATYPSYDLNDIPRDNIALLNSLSRNTLICDIYEPGSTFKVITAAANLEEYEKGNKKAYSPTTIFNSSRIRAVDGTTIKCWSTHENGKHANQNIAQALNTSCNPCFTDMALALGTNNFYEYLSAFGFGDPTNIDFNGESGGIIIKPSVVRNCDLARIGFGQSIALSALQLVCAVGAVVNGGNYFQPHIMKQISSVNGNYTYQTKLKNKPISEKTSALMREMLEGVVRDGSGKKAYIDGYRIGGKTGTAQKYENGHIASGKYVSSFVGFFPVEAPQYVCLIVVDEPQGTYYGSAVAAPVAKEIFQDIISLKHL